MTSRLYSNVTQAFVVVVVVVVDVVVVLILWFQVEQIEKWNFMLHGICQYTSPKVLVRMYPGTSLKVIRVCIPIHLLLLCFFCVFVGFDNSKVMEEPERADI